MDFLFRFGLASFFLMNSLTALWLSLVLYVTFGQDVSEFVMHIGVLFLVAYYFTNAPL